MVLGSKKRDYATEHRTIKARLKKHSKVMQRFMAGGLDHEEASARSFEILAGYRLDGKVTPQP